MSLQRVPHTFCQGVLVFGIFFQNIIQRLSDLSELWKFEFLFAFLVVKCYNEQTFAVLRYKIFSVKYVVTDMIVQFLY